MDRVKRNKSRSRDWRTTEILVVDEVSMMSRELFEIVDAVARHCRRDERPMGGMQVIFSGDFYQIRPVGEDQEFCFESPLWARLFAREDQISLDKIFRQSDPVYARILNQIREGEMDEESRAIMERHVRTDEDEIEKSGFRPTKLFATRRQVDEINHKELARLSATHEMVLTMEDRLDLPMTITEAEKRSRFTAADIQHELLNLRRSLLCEPTIQLRMGAQVMCLVNKDGLWNGSQGVVVGRTEENLPVVCYTNGKKVIMEKHVWPSENIPGIGIAQVPLILAWALTIHKAQGSTMENAEIDVGTSIFECGQTYVALSRVKSLEGLILTSFDPASIYIAPRVREFYHDLLGK